MQAIAFGLDFGTTNSSLAALLPDGAVRLARFHQGAGFTDAFRSLLYLEQIVSAGRKATKSWTGPQGIERYLAAEHKGRLIQSLKSFLSSRSLKNTEIFGRRAALEDLVASIARDLRLEAEKQFGVPIRRVVSGRPVRFVGSETPEDDDYAQARLEISLRKAGFEEIAFEFEPIGAAYFYESTLDHDELILIGDFGGGTSDFSVLRVGPEVRKHGRKPEHLLANEGLGLAGDSFDAKIVRHLVAPALGAGTSLNSAGKILPVPNWVYFKLERWHHLSLLRSSETLNMLRSVERQALAPERIAALLFLVENDLGYHLHRAVQDLKCALSENETATFRFEDGDVSIEAGVARAEFESWIADELAAIETSVSQVLAKAHVHARDIDRVFLTGGSSFVPSVRRIFDTRFGAGRISSGNEFTSVARGLALRGAGG
ncbi:MAG TPA: Hsp70 family protein [Bryobacteraceae bacterium]|nr:Hsp70 family protein [Bryobacteraceae bacterium]